MSSTIRGLVRIPHDNYPTPPEVTLGVLRWLRRRGHTLGTCKGDEARILDPSAGEGAILRTCKEEFWPHVELSGYDIRPECQGPLNDLGCNDAFIVDALDPDIVAYTESQQYDLVIDNPPFSLLRQFIEAYRYTANLTAFLVPAGFLASRERYEWWIAEPPTYELTIADRPCFVAGCRGLPKRVVDGVELPKVPSCKAAYPRGTRGICDCGGRITDGTDSETYEWAIYHGRTKRGETRRDWILNTPDKRKRARHGH